MRASDALGAYGERVAATHLVEAGMSIVERNWRRRVRTHPVRAGGGFGLPRTISVCQPQTR